MQQPATISGWPNNSYALGSGTATAVHDYQMDPNVFALSGAQVRNATETTAPYALFGDVNGNYNSWIPGIGSYTLTGTPYATSSGGTAGLSSP